MSLILRTEFPKIPRRHVWQLYQDIFSAHIPKRHMVLLLGAHGGTRTPESIALQAKPLAALVRVLRYTIYLTQVDNLLLL